MEHAEELPVDEHVVIPETRMELIDGKIVLTPPAHPPHARMHADLGYLLRAHVAEGYLVALDMLTRTSLLSDCAPDASIFPDAPDPLTGGRQLEEVAFEIANRQAIGIPTKKARELIRRGVRRVFCVLVKRSQLLEWSRETDQFEPVPGDTIIEDHCLRLPLPVRALFDAGAADEATARALLERRPPALAAALESSRVEGREEGRASAQAGELERRMAANAQAVLAVLAARGIQVTAAQRERILSSRDLVALERWLERAAVAASTDEALAD